MANGLDLKLIVKHLVNGTFEGNLCRICLMPLSEISENIFTKICKQDKEFCVADILKELCDIQFSDNDNYNVCVDCFIAASNAYKFYLKSLYHNEILNAYTDQLSSNIACIEVVDDVNDESICISLPVVIPDIPVYDFNIEGVITEKRRIKDDLKTNFTKSKPVVKDKKISKKEKLQRKGQNKMKMEQIKTENIEDDDDTLLIIDNEQEEPTFYQMTPNGVLYKVEYETTSAVPDKRSRKRERMTIKECSRCPVEYRFISKLREHMWLAHQVQLFNCKICHTLYEDQQEFNFHMNSHTNIYQCAICNIVFKKREIIIAHLKLHEELQQSSIDNVQYTCKTCGLIMIDEDKLKAHCHMHELKGFTCYYCGRMYKQEVGFNNHIRKHEMYMKQNKKSSSKRESNSESQKHKKYKAQQEDRNFTCELCGRSFMGRRALLWHSRLHTNERPFTCDICGRSFVSLNRRNQHSLCAHTAPTRRCPLCPALFHMKSMISTHIKKVHLKPSKRRTRTVRRRSVSWHTEPVPIQELSIAIQNDILELQASNSLS